MDTRTTLSVSEARKNIFSIIDQVEKLGAVYTLTEKGRPKAVIMSADEFESWVETFEVMKDWPTYKKDIKKAHDDLLHGRAISFEKVLADNGLKIAEKKGKYGVSSRIRKTGTKRHQKA